MIEYDFLLGSTYRNIERSVIISVVIAIASVIVALVVTYYTTKPLDMLTHNMQKIARLDLDSVKETEAPKLIEVKRLYQSYLGMNAALRSFKKFVPVQVISKIIISNKEVMPELKFRHVTVMFQDIEGFTSLSETMSPAVLAKVTSEYMSVMTTIICKHGGTIDKYVGDCIMSLFNAPESVENHPVAATAAAEECVHSLIEKNKIWLQKYGVEMNFRTGIHTGEVLIGNMGSDNRMNYTAFGDNVNIAARLEGVNKFYGTRIMVSKAVYKTFPKGKFVTRKLGKIRVSGKSVATTVFQVVGEVKATTKSLFKNYEKAVLAAKHDQIEEALVHIERALECDPTDKASLHLQMRLREGLASSNWAYIEDLVKY